MNNLKCLLSKLCDENRDGSYSTQANRRKMFDLFCDQLEKSGYRVNEMSLNDLKARHIYSLLKNWNESKKSTGTIKNRMSGLRWLFKKIGKDDLMRKANADYKIENRVYVTNESKALKIGDFDLSKIDENIAQSLVLQAVFGLRREEAMKFQPFFALDSQSIENATYIRLKDSWTKGGRPRIIPISNEIQRSELRKAFDLARKNGGQMGSLIPSNTSYRKHLTRFERISREIGLGNTHSLRHNYAQMRYFELMNFECPAVKFRNLTREEIIKDKQVRLLISEELGHSRIGITNIYLGSWSIKK